MLQLDLQPARGLQNDLANSTLQICNQSWLAKKHFPRRRALYSPDQVQNVCSGQRESHCKKYSACSPRLTPVLYGCRRAKECSSLRRSLIFVRAELLNTSDSISCQLNCNHTQQDSQLVATARFQTSKEFADEGICLVEIEVSSLNRYATASTWIWTDRVELVKSHRIQPFSDTLIIALYHVSLASQEWHFTLFNKRSGKVVEFFC